MVKIDVFAEEFLHTLKEVEKLLLPLGFAPYSFEKKGFAYFVQYKGKNSTVEFLYGPPEYEIEMIVCTTKGKYEFKDLLQIAEISKWVNENRYVQDNKRNIKKELMWSVELLKISLPIIE